ncbi:MAG: PepSY domain-containing protein [Bacillota bacterium]
MLKSLRVLILVAVLGAGTTAIAADKAPAPRISKAAAEATALKLAPGKVTSAEYEYEGGAWRWSFDIQQKGHVQEIGINGQTGKVVENKSEGKVDHD